MLGGRGRRAFGAARAALCLGLALFLVLSGAALYLSSAPGEHSWLGGIFEWAGLLGDANLDAGGAKDRSSGTAGRTATDVDPRDAGDSGAVTGGGEPDLTGGASFDLRPVEGATSAGGGVAAGDARLAASGRGDRGQRVPAGVLYDLGTGRAVTGARILATAFHGTDDAYNAGSPALFQDVLQAEVDGSFQVPLFDSEDPRLLVHLQIDHPEYLPATAVLKRRDAVEAEWQPREIRLRRGLTGRVQIVLAAGEPLARVPVRVVPTEDRHALLERKSVWIAQRLSERLITRGEPSIFYTDDAGYLRLPYSEHFYFLEVLHPLYRLSYRDPYEKRDRRGEILYHVSEARADRLLALEGEPYVATLLDQGGAPIPQAEVEIEWEKRTARTVTDQDGRLVLGLTPPVRYPQLPNARVTLLTPAFFRRGARFKVPDPSSVIDIPSRPARRLEFRTAANRDDPERIAPEGVRVSARGLTLVRRTLDGEVEFQGAVPEAGELLEINVRGYLPREVVLPPSPPEAASVDLGEIVFERGLEKQIVLAGVERSLFEEATLSVSPVERPREVQRVPLRGADHLTVGGLDLGTYHIGVEGPNLRAYSATFQVNETDLEEVVTIPLHETDEEFVVVRGRVMGLDPRQLARLSVIESFFTDGVREPIVMKAYPPASDGAIGSARRMRGVIAVHLSVVSLEDKAVDLHLSRGDEDAVFDAGEVRLLPRPHAEITFFVAGWGRLDPPLHVTLEGEDGLEAHSRFRWHDRRLYIDNLRQGLHRLSWAVGDGGKETIGFEVLSQQVTELQLARSLFVEENVEVRIVDSAGRPIPFASVTPPGFPLGLRAFPMEPGVKLARVKTREKTRLEASSAGFIPVRADVEPGGVVPTEFILYRPASALATVLDTDGIEIDGFVSVSWEPKTPTSIRYGKPFDVEVRNGRFRGDLFPPLPMRFTFRLADSEASVTRVFSLPEDRDLHDLGVLRFEETRSVRGVVFLPDGAPAPGAAVALVEFDRARPFPLRDPRDFSRVRYKARTDVDGGFTMEELPLDLSTELVLVAHQDGFGDAYEFPFDPELDTRELQLELSAGLELDVGYRDGLVRDQFRFSLEYQADPADPETRVDLGEIPAQLFGLNEYSEIEPGLYRVKWGLRDFYDPIPPLYEEVMVEPGAVTRLTLLLDGRELRGKASLNGKPVSTGWILLSDAPAGSASTRVGRISEGRFLVIDPPSSVAVYGAVIPASTPQAIQNIARGEALPQRIRGYTASLRNGFLNFAYEAYNLTLKFSDHFLARYPGAYLTFPHYEWRDGRFSSYKDGEPITSTLVRFHLLPRGIHTFTVRSERGALLLTRPISLQSGTIQLPNGRTLLPALDREILMK